MSTKLAYFSSILRNVVLFKLESKPKFFTNFIHSGKLCLNSGCMDSLSRTIHTSLPRSRIEDRRKMLASVPKKDEGTEGEQTVGVESIKSREDMFPSEDTPNMLFNGIPFKDVPICNIRVSPNNTILTFSDSKGEVKLIRSCGIEGFKNTRKGTNVAAQATAITFSTLVLSKGFKTVRVRVKGLGPGRMSAIKGLQMGGLEIISVTDSTPVSENPPRPRRPKSL